MSHTDHVFAVILAGGGGTRLWPKSRNKTPKQFLKLTGKSTMMQVAAARITKVVPWERIIVVTNEIYKDEVHQQLPEVPVENIIAEPAKKDTALAMLVGSLFALSKDPDAIIINSASDHVVTDEREFTRVMKAAVEVASEQKNLVTVGISPTFASSAFGYIKVGQDIKKVGGGLTVFKVDSFTEKPNEATARAFISTGRYFWNANMYVWSGKTLVEAFKEHFSSMYDLTLPLTKATPADFHAALPEIYNQADAISIDYAISEKANNLVLIPGDFGWDDIGEWKVVYDLGKKDLAGNVIVGEGDGETIKTLTIESQNNLLHVGNRLVALIGVNDMIVVDTDEIIMIAPKKRSQDVKKLVERLKEEGKKEYL
jgi:mannose-1-phosphate guanylyltransferase